MTISQSTIPAHPAAEIFPLLTGAEFDALVADIREHGQREPVVTYDGLILDGRNRYRACEVLGIPPKTEEWGRDGTPEAFVISMNLHRRHLNEGQRAMIAARLASAKSGERTDLRQIGSRSLTVSEAADLLNVGQRTVGAARTVLNEGTPEEIAAADSGDAAVSTIAKQIHEGKPAGARKRNRSTPLSQAGKNPERIQRTKINAEIWGRIRDALTHLTSLPLPSEVATIARSNDRTRLVDDRLEKALQWLKEFESEWHSNG